MSNGGDSTDGRRRPLVALLMFGLADLRGGGGTERFFADVLAEQASRAHRRVDLCLVCDRGSAARLREIGRFAGREEDRVMPFPVGGLSAWRAAFSLLRGAWLRDVDLVHIPLISPLYLPFMWLRALFRGTPPVCITVVDANLAHVWFSPAARNAPERVKSYWLHRIWFGSAPVDGIYTWYRAFRDRFRDERLRGRPLVQAARYCFVDTRRFKPGPGKRPLVVFAARLVETKQPLLFVDAVRAALDLAPEALAGWRFALYGQGRLQAAVRARIDHAGLAGRVELTAAPDMERVFAESSLFVSTQDYENFTSLSMLEAMACGNAVLSRDVGQTRDFVREGENGMLVDGVDAHELGAALVACLSDMERLHAFGARSREITVEQHCAENFLADIETFWCAVLARQTDGGPAA